MCEWGWTVVGEWWGRFSGILVFDFLKTFLSNFEENSLFCLLVPRTTATWVAAFQKGRRYLEDEDLNLQPSTQAGHSTCRQAKRSQKLGLLMNPVELQWLGGGECLQNLCVPRTGCSQAL